METKEAEYVEEYYLNNYSDGSVDDELKAVGSFVIRYAQGRVLDCGCGPVPQLYAIFMPRMEELYAVDLPLASIDFVKEKIANATAWYQTYLPYQKLVESQDGVQGADYILKQVAKIKGVQQADMSDTLPFPDGYFDTVISFYSLGCLNNEEELRRAIANIKRVLKIGGQLLHINTNGQNSNSDLPAYTWRGLDQSSALIKKYLETAGLKVVLEQQTDLNRSGKPMYKYSQISLLRAIKE